MSNWALKRAHHSNWPQPTTPPAEAITITAASKTASAKRKPKATA
jgi:hypothetical protein